MSVRVKVCGITRVEDGLAAAEAGADAVGFIFCGASPRCVAFATAARIIAALPPFVSAVGVFVDPTAEFVHQAITEAGVTALQFHGQEPPGFCRQFTLQTIKAFRVQDEAFLSVLQTYTTGAWLLDSYVPDQHGGTGATFDWGLAVAAKKFGRPLILAGGLTPENVAEAVRQVRPFAVDVSSGVETAPGRKDAAKVRAFIDAARAAAGETVGK